MGENIQDKSIKGELVLETKVEELHSTQASLEERKEDWEGGARKVGIKCKSWWCCRPQGEEHVSRRRTNPCYVCYQTCIDSWDRYYHSYFKDEEYKPRQVNFIFSQDHKTSVGAKTQSQVCYTISMTYLWERDYRTHLSCFFNFVNIYFLNIQ